MILLTCTGVSLIIESGERKLRYLNCRRRRVIPTVDFLQCFKKDRLIRVEIFKGIDQYPKRGRFFPVDICASRKVHLRSCETSQCCYQDTNLKLPLSSRWSFRL